MKALSKVASALSFAHLASIGKKARAESDEEEEKDTPERDHEDGNVKKGKAKGDDDKDYAEEEGKDEEASDEEAEDEDESEKKTKKAKAEDEDAEDDEEEDREVEMRGSSPLAKARRREQARCAAIFASPCAARNPALAANLAFKTRMTRKEALAVLEATPGAVVAHEQRAARNPKVGPGGSIQPTSQQAISARWDSAFAKANPGRR